MGNETFVFCKLALLSYPQWPFYQNDFYNYFSHKFHQQLHCNKAIFHQKDASLENVLYDVLVTVKAAPHECIISTGQP